MRGRDATIPWMLVPVLEVTLEYPRRVDFPVVARGTELLALQTDSLLESGSDRLAILLAVYLAAELQHLAGSEDAKVDKNGTIDNCM